MTTDLYARWQNLTEQRLHVSPAIARSWWGVLEHLYGEPHRKYHTLDHVRALLEGADKYASDESMIHRPTLDLAIWFHDAIYEPGATDNEEASIELFRAFAMTANYGQWPAGTYSSVVTAVADIIRATKHLPFDAGYVLTMFTATRDLMLDLDLAGFALPWPEFEVLQKLVMAEHPNGTAWDRIAFLAGMLRRPQIYRHLTELEEPARANIARHVAEIAGTATTIAARARAAGSRPTE